MAFVLSQVPSGIIRQQAARAVNDGDLEEFVFLLLEALEIPEVRDQVAAALQVTQQRPRPASMPPGLGRKRRRGL